VHILAYTTLRYTQGGIGEGGGPPTKGAWEAYRREGRTSARSLLASLRIERETSAQRGLLALGMREKPLRREASWSPREERKVLKSGSGPWGRRRRSEG